jgi:hypothetical protein
MFNKLVLKKNLRWACKIFFTIFVENKDFSITSVQILSNY